jgi:membrane dipeptidase
MLIRRLAYPLVAPYFSKPPLFFFLPRFRKPSPRSLTQLAISPLVAPNHGANASLSTVAAHIEHIAKITSTKHVGLGSDFDGIEIVPRDLEDVSKYPALFAELIRRGWSDKDLEGLAGGNLLRVMEGAERVQREIEEEGKTGPSMDRWLARPDLAQGWPY